MFLGRFNNIYNIFKLDFTFIKIWFKISLQKVDQVAAHFGQNS